MPDNANTRAPAANSSSQANPTPEASIRAALQAIADGIADGSKLTVSTSVQILDASGAIGMAGEKVEVARTEISIDGDREEVVPVVINAGSLEVPRAIQDLHEQHVAEALAYRKQLLDTLVDFVKTRRLG